MFNKILKTKLNRKLNKKPTVHLTLALLLVSQLSFAQVVTKSHSTGGTKSNNLVLITQDTVSSETPTLNGLTRDDVIIARQQQTKQSKQVLQTSVQNYSADDYLALPHSFSIYTGYSQLITDIDADGYYQTFSVSFDADILSAMANEQAVVYADLYLSQNGGPWILYFSTDDFVITGEDTEDEFEVLTQLDSGFIADYYDVLIDLYEVGYSDVVATYSSDDSNELYALPLESSDYDPEYIEVEYYETHSGSMGWMLFGVLLPLIYRRRFYQFK